jgi:outer membrane protein assembly factor BamB
LVYVFIEDRVYGLDPGTGETRWESAVIGKFGFRSPSPILGANGLMYVDNGLGVFALDIQSGAVRWNTTFQAGTDRILPHLGPDGTVYMLFRGLATNGQYTLKALNGATGEERWSVSNAANSGPLLVGPDGTLYAVNADGSLSAREGRCGTLKWTYTPEPNTFIDTSVTCSLGADGTLYIRAVTNQPFQSRLFAIDTANGTRKWQKELDHGRGVPAIGPDGTLYLLSQDAKLTAHDPATGAERWAFTAPRPQIISQGSPSVAADGTVYFIADKTVYAINGTTGTKAWELTLTESRVEIHGSTPVIGGDGKLYIQDNALPRIYAIR